MSYGGRICNSPNGACTAPGLHDLRFPALGSGSLAHSTPASQSTSQVSFPGQASAILEPQTQQELKQVGGRLGIRHLQQHDESASTAPQYAPFRPTAVAFTVSAEDAARLHIGTSGVETCNGQTIRRASYCMPMSPNGTSIIDREFNVVRRYNESDGTYTYTIRTYKNGPGVTESVWLKIGDSEIKIPAAALLREAVDEEGAAVPDDRARNELRTIRVKTVDEHIEALKELSAFLLDAELNEAATAANAVLGSLKGRQTPTEEQENELRQKYLQAITELNQRDSGAEVLSLLPPLPELAEGYASSLHEWLNPPEQSDPVPSGELREQLPIPGEAAPAYGAQDESMNQEPAAGPEAEPQPEASPEPDQAATALELSLSQSQRLDSVERYLNATYKPYAAFDHSVDGETYRFYAIAPDNRAAFGTLIALQPSADGETLKWRWLYLDNWNSNDWNEDSIKEAISSEDGKLTLQGVNFEGETQRYPAGESLLTRRNLRPASERNHVGARDFRKAQDDFGLSRIAELCELADISQTATIAQNAEAEASALALFQKLPETVNGTEDRRIRSEFDYRYNSMLTHSVLTALVQRDEIQDLKSTIDERQPSLSWTATTKSGNPVRITLSPYSPGGLSVTYLRTQNISPIALDNVESAEELSQTLTKLFRR